MDFAELFENFSSSAFRVEGLSEYKVPEEAEALELFQSIGQLPPGYNIEWVELVSAAVGAGKTMSRLRLLSDELTDYEKFEIAGYAPAQAAGEDVRTARRADYEFVEDFWLFDDTWIARMKYDDQGRWLRADVARVSEQDVEVLDYWKSAFTHAAPLAVS